MFLDCGSCLGTCLLVVSAAVTCVFIAAEGYVKRWWNMPRSTSRAALRLATGIPSLQDIFERVQAVRIGVASRSPDKNVQEVLSRRCVRNHRPWRSIREKIGSFEKKEDLEDLKERLKEAQEKMLAAEVKKLAVQGQWARLEDALQQDRQWKTMMWKLPTYVSQFATKAALDVLPTRANLARWHVDANSACSCGAKETLLHALNGCELRLERYKWRHNSVLAYIVSQIRRQRPDWTLMADLLGFEYKLPFHIEQQYRPDVIVLIRQKIVFVELTIPFEDGFEQAHTRKEKNMCAGFLSQPKQQASYPACSVRR